MGQILIPLTSAKIVWRGNGFTPNNVESAVFEDDDPVILSFIHALLKLNDSLDFSSISFEIKETIDTTELKDITCRVCNAKFPPQKENRYIAEQTTLSFMSGASTMPHEAFDCPVCGCQNLVGVYSPRVRPVISPTKE